MGHELTVPMGAVLLLLRQGGQAYITLEGGEAHGWFFVNLREPCRRASPQPTRLTSPALSCILTLKGGREGFSCSR